MQKKREQELATKDAEENQKINELRKQGQNDLEHWYNERHKQIEQKRQIIKIEENNLLINLLDFTDEKQYSKSKQDLTRMKSCIFTGKRISDSKKLENSF
ncbi:unnamed protein product [Rotaria sp. Silwood1]|nr:unnamed protein product [Rotaria sp. Silwood1]CAF1567209.1 unnamed protein product [Rotaria sp. Silwood1]